MTHSDDSGLVLPPNLAPIQVVLVPIYKGEKQQKEIAKVANHMKKALESKNIRVKFDNRDKFKPGYKFNEYELKGVPLRIAIGPKDIENGTVEIARRDTFSKTLVDQDEVVDFISMKLDQIQSDLFQKALGFRESHITEVENFEEFKEIIDNKGGFVSAHWDGTEETEEAIKNQTKASIRCIPLESKEEQGKCVFSGNPSKQRVLFAKAY
jgi:prolyl-tRNA synthetase